MDVNEFSVAFTIAVTEVSNPAVDFVAKNGKYSIFSILQGIFPQARDFLLLDLLVILDIA